MLAFSAQAQLGHSSPPLEFEVASVKKTPVDGSHGRRLNTLPGGRVVIRGMTPTDMIMWAYRPIAPTCIAGAPAWTASEWFDIDARAETPGTVGTEELKQLLQSLLTSRFGLKAHMEKQIRPYFALVVTKNGHRLVASEKVGEPVVRSSSTLKPDGERPEQYLMATRSFYGRNVTMARLALQLNYGSDRVVFDETGLAGTFDYEFGSEADERDSPSLPLLNAVLVDRLGLKLEPRRGPVEVLVVEHIDRPSAN